jgi:hypothetical protein
MDAPTFVFENNPFSLRLLSLERRGRGGRAYKVIDDKGRLFDLREDTMMDAIRIGGVEKGGQFGATFVWGASSTLKLLVVGSKSYEKVSGASEAARAARANARAAAPLTGKDLEVGGVYESLDRYSKSFAYVGRVTCPVTQKRRYAVLREGHWRGESVITFASSVRAVKKLKDTDVSKARANSNLTFHYASGNGDRYDSQLEEPAVRDTRVIFDMEFDGQKIMNQRSHWSGPRYYETREWKQAQAIHEAEKLARLRVYRDALIWHD